MRPRSPSLQSFEQRGPSVRELMAIVSNAKRHDTLVYGIFISACVDTEWSRIRLTAAFSDTHVQFCMHSSSKSCDCWTECPGMVLCGSWCSKTATRTVLKLVRPCPGKRSSMQAVPQDVITVRLAATVCGTVRKEWPVLRDCCTAWTEAIPIHLTKAGVLSGLPTPDQTGAEF
jgi:hypothetical protein